MVSDAFCAGKSVRTCNPARELRVICFPSCAFAAEACTGADPGLIFPPEFLGGIAVKEREGRGVVWIEEVWES